MRCGSKNFKHGLGNHPENYPGYYRTDAHGSPPKSPNILEEKKRHSRECTRAPHSLRAERDRRLERLDLSFQLLTGDVEPEPLLSEQVCRLEELDRLILEVVRCRSDPITSVQPAVELVAGRPGKR